MLPPPGFSPTDARYADYDTPTATTVLTTVLSSLTPTAGTIFSFSSTPTPTFLPEMKPHHDEPPNGECELLGPFALLIQLALGVLALTSLVWKRWRERPQRPLKIWFFDVSKQVFGSALLHVANLLMSMLSSGQLSMKLDPASVQTVRRMVDAQAEASGNGPNPCSFYLLNLAIDTTLGIPILVILLRICHGLAAKTPFGEPPESIQSGNYGSPPRATWWLKQSIIYFFSLLGMKICVLIIFVLLPWIGAVGDWALRWTEGNEKLQVFFVMLFFPVVMNAAQYYIIDGFIKKPNEHERIPSEDGSSYDGDSDGERGRFVSASAQDTESEDEDAARGKSNVRATEKRAAANSRAEYDPSVDGESATTVVGSSSSETTGKKVAEESSV